MTVGWALPLLPTSPPLPISPLYPPTPRLGRALGLLKISTTQEAGGGHIKGLAESLCGNKGLKPPPRPVSTAVLAGSTLHTHTNAPL